jgi:hypothetical protein
MGSEESEQVLTLLKELSVLKELEKESEAGGDSDSEQGTHQLRRQEIAQEINALAEQKKKKSSEQAPT